MSDAPTFPPPDVTPPCTSAPELFHAAVGYFSRDDQAQIEQAKAICATCPIVADCLAYAHASGDRHAILGGTTPDERRHQQPKHAGRGRPRKTSTCGTVAGYERHRLDGEPTCDKCRAAMAARGRANRARRRARQAAA